MSNTDPASIPADRLVWRRLDIERRFGFSGSRFTRVGSALPAAIAIALTLAFFGVLLSIGSSGWSDMFTRRGWTPFVIVLFALWSVMILWIKRSKLRLQRKALSLRVIPDEMNFVLSVETVDQVIRRLYEVVDHPKHFVLMHRIDVGLSNVRNLSRVVDLGEILRTQSDHDESVMETSFNLIRGLVWAIPILGFIGTVSGLSSAIGGFGRVLSQTEDPAQLIDALKGVTGGLATAFETTLLALIAALLVQMLMTFQKKREEEFLDECTEYCQRELLSRLWSPDPQSSTMMTDLAPTANKQRKTTTPPTSKSHSEQLAKRPPPASSDKPAQSKKSTPRKTVSTVKKETSATNPLPTKPTPQTSRSAAAPVINPVADEEIPVAELAEPEDDIFEADLVDESDPWNELQ